MATKDNLLHPIIGIIEYIVRFYTYDTKFEYLDQYWCFAKHK